MNCKPGQKAILTRVVGVKPAEAYLGMVFVVVRVAGKSAAGPIWDVEPGHFHRANGVTFKIGDPIRQVADCLLTPLPDDPEPDTVVDETKEIEHV